MHGVRRNSVLALFVLSGAASLVYEVVWSRMLTLVFGVASFAVATVLAAYMGGLALGAFLFGRYWKRSIHPLAIYGLLEIGVGLYALAMPHLLGAVQGAYLAIFHALGLEGHATAYALIRFVLAGALLLPPTTLMGGTLPLLVRWWGGEARSRGIASGRTALLYGLNTAGATAGTLLSGFVLMPAVGVRGTTLSAALVNFSLGLTVILLSRGAARDRAGGDRPALREEEPPAAAKIAAAGPARSDGKRRWAAAAFALSGAVALCYEIYWTRVLVLIIGPSVYAFTLMLTAFLGGLAAGSATVTPLVRRRGDRFLQFAVLQWIIALSSVGAMLLFSRFPYWFIRMSGALGESSSAVTLAAVPLLVATMFVPTLAMGATFPVAADLFRKRGGRLARSVGDIYTCNTAGGIAGSFLGGFVLLPLLGVRNGLILLAALNGALGLALLAGARPGRTRRAALVAAAAGALLLGGVRVLSGAPLWDEKKMTVGPFQRGIREIVARPGRLDRYLADTELLYYAEGLVSTITVRRQGNTLTLQTNGKTDASSGGDQRTQVLLGQLPMLFHEEPRDALVIGLASGISAANVLSQGARSVVVAELEAKMVRASDYFRPWNGDLLDDPAVTVRIDDARNYLLTTDRRFDVIVSEPSNPWISGVNNLFTLEAFELLRGRLNRGGIVAQWFHYYGMAAADLLALLNTFHLAFDHVELFEAQRGDLIMLGSEKELSFDFDTIRRRMESPGNGERLKRLGIPTLYDLLALYRFPLEGVRVPPAVREARVNTDDNMLLEFSAPRHLYSRASERNRELLGRLRDRHKIYRGVPGEHARLAEGGVRAWDLAGAEEELALEEESPRPDRNAVHNLRGRILLLRAAEEGKPELARPALEEIDAALAADSTSSTSYFLKGSAQLRLNDPAAAAEAFGNALRLGEDPAVVLGFLGLARERAGRLEEAAQSYAAALRLDEGNLVARQGLARLTGAGRAGGTPARTRPGGGPGPP